MLIEVLQVSITAGIGLAVLILSNVEKRRRSGVRRTEQARRDLIEARTRARNCPQG